MLREDKRGPAAVGPVNHRDRQIGQLAPGWSPRWPDRSLAIVPRRSPRLARKPQRCGQVRQVVRQDDASSGHRYELDASVDFANLLVTHRRVARAEVHRLVGELGNPGAASDGLVVHVEVRVRAHEVLEPAVIQRRGKARAGAVKIGGDLARGRRTAAAQAAARQTPRTSTETKAERDIVHSSFWREGAHRSDGFPRRAVHQCREEPTGRLRRAGVTSVNFV